MEAFAKDNLLAHVLNIVKVEGLGRAAEREGKARLHAREVLAVERDAIARPPLLKNNLDLALARVGERAVL